MKVQPNTSMEAITLTKKQRTNRPRRNRTHISPILYADVSSDSLSSTLTSTYSTLNNDNNNSKRLKLNPLSSSHPPPNDTVSCVESKETAVSVVEESSLNDLDCREEFCNYDDYDEVVYGSCRSESSEFEFSDYSSSLLFDSSSSSGTDESSPVTSKSYQMLIEFRNNFIRSSTCVVRYTPKELCVPLQISALEEIEEEESYKLLRERERKGAYAYDYVESYKTSTEYGELVFNQRIQMVHWIIQQSKANAYEEETMFLGVRLMDRFLSKGLFESKRNLQILGIACLTLATRIEQNQPYNTIRQKMFCIEKNEYSRHEVVGMEWFVQEVLNFHCYIPTISNFLPFYLKAAKADGELEKRARYLAIMALSDHDHLAFWPSTVAASLVILACAETSYMDSYQRVIQVHVRAKENDLHECIESLEWLLQYVN